MLNYRAYFTDTEYKMNTKWRKKMINENQKETNKEYRENYERIFGKKQ